MRKNSLTALAALSALQLVACGKDEGGAPPPPEVSVITLKPRAVQITDQLPGRTTAFRVAEVRPQVTGVVQKRLFAEGTEVKAGEHWFDVELATQILTAYAGDRPMFATLVSTGRGPAGTVLATPPGLHRIWVKLASSDMDNLENLEANENYAIQAVPWVMYFQAGYGLHGTFWHRAFGRVQSHGCVNLSPADAERLFHFASPHLPSGWTAALPTVYEQGSLVRVR